MRFQEISYRRFPLVPRPVGGKSDQVIELVDDQDAVPLPEPSGDDPLGATELQERAVMQHAVSFHARLADCIPYPRHQRLERVAFADLYAVAPLNEIITIRANGNFPRNA
jgi:hypothetical protein